MKKFISALLFLSAFGWFFYQPIAQKVVGLCLHEFGQRALGGNLEFANLFKNEDGAWVAENLSVTSHRPLADGGHIFHVERASFRFSLPWIKQRAVLECFLDHPKFDIGKEALDFKQLLVLPENKSFLNLEYRLNVQQGSICLHDDNEISELKFELTAMLPKSPKGQMTLWFGSTKNERNCVQLSLSKPPKGRPQIVLNMQHLQCCDIQNFIAKLCPEVARFLIKQGELHGQARLDFLPKNKFSLEGDASLKELAFSYPLFKVEGILPDIQLAIKDHADEASSGRVEIAQNGTINLYKEGQPYCVLNALSGGLSFDKREGARLAVEGVCHYKGEERPLRLDGVAHLNSKEQGSVNLSLQVKDQVQGDITMGFFARQLGALWNFLEIEISNFSVNEFHVFQTLLEGCFPEVNQLDMRSGILNGNLLLYVQKFALHEVNVEKISASHLDLDLFPWDISIQAEEAVGTASLNLSQPNITQTINGDMRLVNGKLNFNAFHHEAWQFSGLDSELSIRKGVLQKTRLNGEIAGFQGVLEIDGSSPEQILKADFSGTLNKLARLMPVSMQKGLKDQFANDNVTISAKAKKAHSGIAVEGITRIENDLKHSIPFGFEIILSEGNHWSGSTFSIKNGNFNAAALPLAKFVSPFLFHKGTMQLKGKGDFVGKFDHEGLCLYYNVEQLNIENDDFAIDAKSFRDADPHTPLLPANHFFNFKTGESYGSVTIHNGTYFEKNSGLLFTDINALINLENTRLHIPKIESFCNGIFAAGNLDVDWGKPEEGVFDVTIHTETINGKFSQVQQFFSHFKKPFHFLKIPLEGQVALRSQGGFLKFSFRPDEYEFDARVQATFTDGVITSDETDLSLQDLSFNFDYDHKGHLLEFNEIQGTLLVGKPERAEEYAFLSDRIRFRNLEQSQGEFDLIISDKKRDLLRLVGKTDRSSLEEFQEGVEFKLDHALSHFGEIHPKAFNLIVKPDLTQIHLFNLQVDIQVASLLRDIKRFSQTGLFFLTRHMLKRLENLKRAEGDIQLTLDYNGSESLLRYQLLGERLHIGDYDFQTCQLMGKKKGNLWMIDQLQFDDISLAADFFKEHENWKINFLGFRAGRSLLLGLDGVYFPNENFLEANLNLVESDLAFLNEWESLEKFSSKFPMQGLFRGNGKMHVHFSKGSGGPGYQADLALKANVHGGRFRELNLLDIDQMGVELHSDQGITFTRISSALKSLEDQRIQGKFEIDKLGISFGNGDVSLEGVRFNAPVKNLEWVTNNLQKNFPDAFTPQAAEIVRNCKKEGSLCGEMNLTLADPYFAFRATLLDDDYFFANRVHSVKNFTLDVNPFGLKVLTQYSHQNHLFWLQAKASAPKFNEGEVVLSDQQPQPGKHFPSLAVQWKIDENQGLVIQKGEGTFSGLTVDLAQNLQDPTTSKSLKLKGTVKINFAEAAKLMPENIHQQIAAFEVGNGYFLKGEWEIGKEEEIDLVDQISFLGVFGGENLSLEGYQFQHLFSHLAVSPHDIVLNGIQLEDPCGKVSIPKLQLRRIEDKSWVLSAPIASVEEFRPSLLRLCNTPLPYTAKSFVVEYVHLQDLQGKLGERESFTGKGELCFASPSKKNLQNTIFAIPAEILSRIGLDLAVLNPVTGTIFYEIRDAKFILNRFKDIYSEGRLSKFYMPSSPYDSYMDFDGNLNVQVRMKQYNLLFKLAELFTFTIKGTIKKPTYSLQRQNSNHPSKNVMAKDNV